MEEITNTPCPRYKRFLTDRTEKYEKYITAAKNYVDKVHEINHTHFLYLKPYDQSWYNKEYYNHMYNVLNLIRTMNIKPFGHVLEVGCGPGWITELLMALGYTVDALEPSEDFIEIAKEKVASFQRHLRLKNPPQVTFHCKTLEEFESPENTYDAIFFYAVLHHVVDEVKGLENCYKTLKIGGVIGINEGVWKPGNREIERTLEKEMEMYGVLENPFTAEYLDYLLETCGFKQITHYNQVNGLFPSSVVDNSIKSVLTARAEDANIVIAVKQPLNCKTTEDPEADTRAEITVINKSFSNETLRLTVKIKNIGETIWLHDPVYCHGWISLGLVNKVTREEAGRFRIGRNIYPGEDTTVEMRYYMPDYSEQTPWCLDLINEGYYWLESKGFTPVLI